MHCCDSVLKLIGCTESTVLRAVLSCWQCRGQYCRHLVFFQSGEEVRVRKENRGFLKTLSNIYLIKLLTRDLEEIKQSAGASRWRLWATCAEYTGPVFTVSVRQQHWRRLGSSSVDPSGSAWVKTVQKFFTNKCK